MQGSPSTKLLSISLGSSKTATSAKAKGKKRPYASLVADDSGDEQSQAHGKSQLVSSFDHSAGGAISLGEDKNPKQTPLVIPTQKNRDWRREAQQKRSKNLLPKEEQVRRQGEGFKGTTDDNKEERKQVYGLIVHEPSENRNEDGDARMVDGGTENATSVTEDRPKTEDEEALDALLGKKKESTLVISSDEPGNRQLAPRASEEDAFRSDVASRPDPASMADYEAIPIEAFGEALLRGMAGGWKPGDPIGRRKGVSSKPRVLEARPALLGIGAKEVPDGLEELGAWGKGSKKTNKIDRTYNPVVRRNARTGEMLTEEQLKERQKQNEFVEDDRMDKRESKSHGDKAESSRSRRNRDSERDIEDARYKSTKRDRSRSRDKGWRRERDYDGHRRRDRDYDSERGDHERRKEKKFREREDDYDDRRHRRSHYDSDSKDRRHRRDHDEYDDRRRHRHTDKRRERD